MSPLSPLLKKMSRPVSRHLLSACLCLACASAFAQATRAPVEVLPLPREFELLSDTDIMGSCGVMLSFLGAAGASVKDAPVKELADAAETLAIARVYLRDAQAEGMSSQDLARLRALYGSRDPLKEALAYCQYTGSARWAGMTPNQRFAFSMLALKDVQKYRDAAR